jgi:hypothetical protein
MQNLYLLPTTTTVEYNGTTSTLRPSMNIGGNADNCTGTTVLKYRSSLLNKSLAIGTTAHTWLYVYMLFMSSQTNLLFIIIRVTGSENRL